MSGLCKETGRMLAARVPLEARVNFGQGLTGTVKAYRLEGSRQVLTVRPDDGGQAFVCAVEIDGKRDVPGFVTAGPIDRHGAVELARRVLARQSERIPVTQALNDLAAAVLHLNDVIEGSDGQGNPDADADPGARPAVAGNPGAGAHDGRPLGHGGGGQ